MAHQKSSSPLSSIPDYPDLSLRQTDHHQIPAQPRKRSLQKPPDDADTQLKKPRRQSKTDLAKKSYDEENPYENPLFHKPPPQPETSPAISPLPPQLPQIPSEPAKSSKARNKRNAPKLVQWNSLEPEKSQQASNHTRPRLWIESQGSRSFPAHLRSYGPLWEPPAIVHLIHNLSREWEVKSEPMEATAALRKRMQAAEANLPYAPAMQLLTDLGWYKSKWNREEHRENDRWGGWYDHIKLDFSSFLQSHLDDQQAEEYLPNGVQFPAAFEERTPSPQKPTRLIRNSLHNQWAAEGNKGSLSLYAGPLSVGKSTDGKEIIEQQRFTFQRFASCRLSEVTLPNLSIFLDPWPSIC